MNRKSQVTIFIILGIIIIIALGLVLVIRGAVNLDKPPLEHIEISTEIIPVQTYVTSCLTSISKRGLKQIGMNGGYLELPPSLTVSPVAYDSDVVIFPPNKIPYWHHIKDCPYSTIGCFESSHPYLCDEGDVCVIPGESGAVSIAGQLADYVEEHLKDCINNFQTFENQFEIIDGDVSANAIITESGVIVKIEYPLDITSKSTGLNEKISMFTKELDVRLADVYSLADEIAFMQKNTTFLEMMALNLITVYSGIEKEIPPMSGMEFFVAEKKYWIRTEVEELLKNDVLPYLSMIQVVNANNYQQLHSTVYDDTYSIYAHGFMQSFDIKIGDEMLDYNINFIYPYSDVYFRIGDSELIQPSDYKGDSSIMQLTGFFMNDYNFKYDLSFPMIITIEDADAFNGEGFKFSIALEANIRNNIPVTEAMNLLDMQTPIFASPNSPNTKVNKIIKVNVINKRNKEPISDANIYYRCGLQYTIGQTNANGILEEKYPFCQLGGQIVISKDGFMSLGIPYNNYDEIGSPEFNVELWPLQKKNITILKRTQKNVQNIENYGPGAIAIYANESENLSSFESVMLNLQRIKESPYESDVPLSGFLMYAPTAEIDMKEKQIQQINELYEQELINESLRDEYLSQIEELDAQPLQRDEYVLEFAPGTYEMEATLLYDGGLFIPEKTESVCVLGAEPVCLDYDEIKYPEQNFTTWISGGAKMQFELNENMIYNDDGLTFYVLQMELPTNWDDMKEFTSIDDYQAGKESYLFPLRE